VQAVLGGLTDATLNINSGIHLAQDRVMRPSVTSRVNVFINGGIFLII